MEKKLARIFSTLLILIMVTSMLAACGTSNKTGVPSGEQTPNTQTQEQASKEPITITYWVDLNLDVAQTETNLGKIPMYQELEKRTGVKVEFQHPPAGEDQRREQFNLMVASRTFPDVIEYDWINYPGGPDKAISDGIIIPINDLLQDHAPNFKAELDKDATRAKLFRTDGGKYYGFPFIKDPADNGWTMVWHGPIIRQDMADELGLTAPTTIDEWTAFLRTAKKKKDLPAPLTFMWNRLPWSNSFVGAFGVGKEFYQEDGKVKFGPIEPGYKDFLILFKNWYDEGLLDPDFASVDAKSLDAKVTGDKSIAIIGNAGGSIGKYMGVMVPTNPNFSLVGVPYPVINKGETPKFGQKDWDYDTNSCTAITTANKFPKETAAWLDYAYSPEGHMLFNFGLEGESYELVDGQPKFTELITNNPDGLPLYTILNRYTRCAYNGPFGEDKRANMVYFPFDQCIEAVSTWSKADSFRRVPPITPSPEESKEFASIMTEINTYVEEMTLGIIMGREDISVYDTFVENIKEMGIDKAIAIQQNALERFNNR